MNKTFVKILTAALCLGTLAASAWEPAPGAAVHPRPVSKSLWIWTADKPVSNGAIALFRFKAELSADVRSAVVKINYDDGGTLWVNGRNLPGKHTHSGTRVYDIAKFLKKGRNLVAVEVKNGRGRAGVMLYGEIKLANGKSVFLHSGADIKSISGPLNAPWKEWGYDDSKWQKSLVQGDVLSAPWSRYRDLVRDFLSPAELKLYEERQSKALRLPSGLKDEKFKPASIALKEGLPHFKIGDEYLLPLLDLTPGGDMYSDSSVIRNAAAGIRFFHVAQTEETFLRPDGTLTFERMDKMVRRTLNLVPDAKICLNFRISSMADFCKKNPGETMVFGTGKVDNSGELYGRPLRPSPASAKLRLCLKDWMTQLAAFVHKQPWSKRVAAIRVSYGTYSEWHSHGMFHAPDLSQPMQKAFRKYLKEKYKDVSALRKAWKDPKVTFESASVPTAQERWVPERFFRNPKDDAKELDFYDCYAHTHADLLLYLAKLAKTLFPGRLCGAYYGYALCSHPPEGSTVLLDKVASSPYIDYMSSPAPYSPFSRLAGGDSLSRGIASTLSRYGKIMLIEDDSRFHHISRYSEKNITTRSPLESRMNMRRNMLNILFERCGLQLNDAADGKMLRPGVFDDPAVNQGLSEAQAVIRKALPLAKDSGNEIAVVFNYMERLRHYTPRHSRILMSHFINSETLNKLYRSGYPFDLMSHTDFFASKKQYKVYVFLNAFTLSAAERTALKAKIRRKGVSAVFLSGAGYASPEGFSEAAMEELTGMKITVDKKGKNSTLVYDNNAGRAGTLQRGAAERFIVADPGAEVFGIYAGDKKPGAAVKMLPEGSKVIYSGNIPVKAAHWRNIFAKAGLKPMTGADSYIRRHGNLVMFHTGTKGPHTITLPPNFKGAVELFSGRKYSGRVITLHSAEGPGTWCFKCF